MKSLFEQLGGTYTRQGDYCLPNVCLPPEEKRPIGIYECSIGNEGIWISFTEIAAFRWQQTYLFKLF